MDAIPGASTNAPQPYKPLLSNFKPTVNPVKEKMSGDISPHRGRPKNKGFEELNFELRRKVFNNKYKYYALCLNCNTELRNTSESRLIIHRKRCMVKHEESTNGDCFKELAEPPSILHPDCSIETFLNHPNVEIEYMDTVPDTFISTPSNNNSIVTIKSEAKTKSPSKKKRKQEVKNEEGTPGDCDVGDAIGKFFFGCNIPLSVVESDHFVNLIRVLNPGVVGKIPGTNALSTSILDRIYNECNANVGPHSVMLIDGWKSSNMTTVATMIHNANSSSAFLLSDVGGIQEIVEKSLRIAKGKYKTDVYCIVSENAGVLKENLTMYSMWYSNCNSHTGNLLAKDLLSIHQPCLDKALSILTEFSNSDLQRALTENGGQQIKLLGDTCESQRDAISSLLFNLKVMKKVVPNSNKIKELLFDNSLEPSCERLVKLLIPICALVNAAQEPSCTLVDIAGLWLKLAYNPIYSSGVVGELVRKHMECSLNVYALSAYYFSMGNKSVNLSKAQQSTVDEFLIVELDKNGLEQLIHFKECTGLFRSLMEKNITDSLIFWKTASVKYPELSQFVIKLLQIPASCAQVQRLFTNSNVHSRHHNKLTLERYNKLLHVYYSLKLKDAHKSDEY